MREADREALGNLLRRRAIVAGLMEHTRAQIDSIMEGLEDSTRVDQEEIARLRALVFQGKVLVRVMYRIAREAVALSERVNAPTINPDELDVPNHLPKEL